MDNRCCFCNNIIPEGRIVCPICEKISLETSKDTAKAIDTIIKGSCLDCHNRGSSYCIYCKRNPNFIDNYSSKD